jgi:hypothetical protein
VLLGLLCACDDDDDGSFERPRRDAGDNEDRTPGVCKLADCPTPDMGIACCTPFAECGMDVSGLGVNCVPNPGSISGDRECVLDECDDPTVGNKCCTPLAECGFDPFGGGEVCLPFPPPGTDIELCDPAACPDPQGGGFGCCLPNGECGVDPFGINWCFAIVVIEEEDAGTIDVPPIPTEPPDDPSITGECPSFLGDIGPLWGCCSDFGVCGVFEFEQCLLPVGTELPVGPPPDEDADGGADEPFLRCTPPD